mgnify:CR=1 FL=1
MLLWRQWKKRKEDEEKKEIRFEVPSFCHKDHLIQYIIQHLEIYHSEVEFKSQKDKQQKEKDKAEGNQETRIIESLRYVEPMRLVSNRSEPIYP